jgi:hypothetical protein
VPSYDTPRVSGGGRHRARLLAKGSVVHKAGALVRLAIDPLNNKTHLAEEPEACCSYSGVQRCKSNVLGDPRFY